MSSVKEVAKPRTTWSGTMEELGKTISKILLEVQEQRRVDQEEKRPKPKTHNLQPYKGEDIEQFLLGSRRSMSLYNTEEDECMFIISCAVVDRESAGCL